MPEFIVTMGVVALGAVLAGALLALFASMRSSQVERLQEAVHAKTTSADGADL